MFNEGVDRKYVPTAHRVYQAKSDAKAAEHLSFVDVGACQESLRDFSLSFMPPLETANSEEICTVFVSESFLTISDTTTAIPFTCMWLLLVAKCFLEAGRKLRLVLDFTHDILLQNFKLGVISIAGFHFTVVIG